MKYLKFIDLYKKQEKSNRINIKSKKIILSVFILLSFFMISNIYGADYTIKDYKINAVVNQNGNLTVEENLIYKFDENMNGLFRDIIYAYLFNGQKDDISATSKRYQAGNIKDIKVYTSDYSFDNLQESSLQDINSLSNGMSDVHGISYTSDEIYGANIKVYSPVKAGAYKYVRYKYVLEDVCVKYIDKGEFYWNFLGKDWQTDIDNLDINIAFEGDLKATDVLLYPHTYAKEVVNTSDAANNKISFNVKNISPGVAVDARVVFDGTALTSATKTINENYDITALQKQEGSMGNSKNMKFISEIVIFILIILGVVNIIFAIYKGIKITADARVKKDEIGYYTEPLNQFSLGEYSLMMSLSKGYNDINLLMATILDLSNRKYIKLDARKKVKKSMFSGKIDYEYFMSINTSSNLEELSDYEKNIINLLFENKVSNNINIDKIKDMEIELNASFKKLENKESEITKYSSMLTVENSKAKGKIYDKVPYKNWYVFWKITLVLVLAAILDILVLSPLNFDIKLSMLVVIPFAIAIYCATLAIICYSYSNILKSTIKEEYKKLKGLEKYLNDYSLIKDRYPIEMVLWDRYLVFATMFGIAKKVSEEFKAQLSAQGYNEDYIYTNFPYISMGYNMYAIQSIVSSSTTIASSSSGGYSGGGSGGGGRRWPVAVELFS